MSKSKISPPSFANINTYWREKILDSIFNPKEWDSKTGKNKMKKFKLTKKQKEKLIPYIKFYRAYETAFYSAVGALEGVMEADTGIEGIEFFWADNVCVGIGNADRTMELYHFEDIEGVK